MPISFSIDRGNDVILRVVRGSITVEEVLQSFEAVFKHPDFHQGIKSLTDARHLERHTSPEDIKQIAKAIWRHKNKIAGGRAAVVVEGDVSYGMMRMLQAYADETSLEIRIFYDMDQARRWLRIETP